MLAKIADAEKLKVEEKDFNNWLMREAMRGVTVAPDGELRIGALTTIAELAAHPVIAEKFAALAKMSTGSQELGYDLLWQGAPE